MGLLKLEPFPNFSKTLEKNKWADFLELMCLEAPDKEISLNDIMTRYTQEELSGISSGDENHSQKVDDTRAQFLEIFRYIFSRMDYLDEFYPFIKIDEDTIKIVEIDEKKQMYFFLLLSSNTDYITDKQIPSFLTRSFERVSIDIMKILYPNFKNEVFGTATKRGEYFYGGLLINKLEKLGICLNTSLTAEAENNSRFQHSSGDAGLDLVSFHMLDHDKCTAYMLPVCIGQCSCSYRDWYNKQYSIKIDSLDNLFNRVANCHEYMFVSFPLRGIDGKWAFEEATRIQTIVIDRIRFLNILFLNDKTTVLDNEMMNCMKSMLGQLDV